MLLYGAGGHAKVLLAAIQASGAKLCGVFDDSPLATFPAVPIFKTYIKSFMPEESLIISIGENEIRKQISATVYHAFGKIIHPSALVDNTSVIGMGTVLLHRSVVQTAALLGRHVIINTGAIIEHDCVIHDFVHIAPGAVLCGNVTVGECTLVGAGSIIVPGTQIGKSCLIAAGSVVTSNIPDHCIVRGNPARIINRK